MEERLHKLLAQWGIASRRRAERLISAQRVEVNGAIASLGQKVDPYRDTIRVDGVQVGVDNQPQTLYLLMHKPTNVVCTCADPQGRITVLDLLPQALSQQQGLHPVGRLDRYSTGALLLTNDGDFTYRLTHPSHQITKTYHVVVEGNPRLASLEQWRQGIVLSGRKTLPAQVNVLKRSRRQTELEIILKEGRNRQIRRVAELLGHPVIKLHRVAIGSVQINTLSSGQYRPLKTTEIRQLASATDEFMSNLQ